MKKVTTRGKKEALVLQLEHPALCAAPCRFALALSRNAPPPAAQLARNAGARRRERRSEHFTRERITKFPSYFERGLEGGCGSYVFGDDVSYVDLSLFQVLEGLRYAFPKAVAQVAPGVARLVALGERVRGRPRIAAYLASPRRLAFNEDGIFRRHQELDVLAAAR